MKKGILPELKRDRIMAREKERERGIILLK